MPTSSPPDSSECRWYHSMDLPDLGEVVGDWDLRGRFDEYVGEVDLSGKTVLDVGAASGFLTFEAEKRGAIVTSFDADRVEQIQTIPPGAFDPAYFTGMRNGYRLAHRLHRSSAKTVYGDIYRLGDSVPPHDVVIVAQILVHLRDPLGALEQAARACRDTLVIAEGMFPEPMWPVAAYLGDRTTFGWWSLSPPIYRSWLEKFGFAIDREHAAHYPCAIPASADETITTIVARRITAQSP